MIKESIFAAEEREARLDKLGDNLQCLEKPVDFVALAAAIDRAASRPGLDRGGRKPYSTELMVRQIPTFWTFRERLSTAEASETLFDAVNHELEKQGYIARGGQMIDASIVPVPKQHNRKAEKELIDWSSARIKGSE